VFNANPVKILIKRPNGSVQKTYNLHSMKAGNHSKKVKAPGKPRSHYTVEVFAKLSCGRQSIKHRLDVS
jgi:hypothetical protein